MPDSVSRKLSVGFLGEDGLMGIYKGNLELKERRRRERERERERNFQFGFWFINFERDFCFVLV